MKAIIMAGGGGTRLRPLTCKQPKPLVQLLDKPVMEYSLALLQKHGIKEAGVTVCYLGHRIIKEIGESYGDMKLCYFDEKTPLGTAGAVLNSGDFPQEALLVLSADALCDIDLTAAIKHHKKSGCTATMVLKRVPIPLEYGVVLLNSQNLVTGFVEKPDWTQVYGDLVNTGIYIVEPSVWNGFTKGQNFDFAKDVFVNMLRDNMPINGYVTDGYWCDIGNIDQYLQAQKALLQGVCKADIDADDYDGIFVQDGAQIDGTAIIKPPCFIGKGAVIGANCAIEPYSVICKGARIGRGTSIKQGIIGKNARVGANAQIRAAIICEDAVIQDGAGIFEGSVIAQGAKVLKDSQVHKSARIWPEKVAEGDIDGNVVWGKAKPCESGSTIGLDDASPELYARLGKAIGLCANNAVICVAGDGEPQSAAFKQSLMGGLLFSGAQLYDLKCCPPAVLSASVREYKADYGAYISGGSIQVLNGLGNQASCEFMRAVMSALEQGAQGQAEPGVIRAQIDPLPLYLAALTAPYTGKLEGMSAVFLGDDQSARLLKLAIGMCGGGFIRAQDADEVKRAVRTQGALGVGISGSKLEIYTAKGVPEPIAVSMLFALLELESGLKELFADSSFPDGFLECAKAYGATITCVHSRLLPLKDPYWQVLALMQYIASHKTNLDSLLAKLPSLRQTSRNVKVDLTDISRILRSVGDQSDSERMDRTEGLKLYKDGAWIHIVPRDASINITTTSLNEEYSKELADIYTGRVKKLLEKK